METAATEALTLIKMGIVNGPAIVNAVQQYSRKINANHWPVGISPSQAEPAATAAAWALGTLGSEWWFRTAGNSSKLDHMVAKSKLGTAYAMTGSASAQVKRLLFCAVLVSSVGAQQRVDVTIGLRKALASGANKMRSTLIGKANETALLDMDLVYNNWTVALIADICRLACRVKAVGTPFVGHQVLGTNFNAWDAVLSASGVDQPLAAPTGLLHFSKVVGILHKYGYAYYFGSQAFIGTHPRPYQFIDYDSLPEETDELLRSLEPQFKDPIGSATRSICTQSGTSISLVAEAAVSSLQQQFGDTWIYCCIYQDVTEQADAALAAALGKETVAPDDRLLDILWALPEDLIVGQFTNDCWGERYNALHKYPEISSDPLVICATFACSSRDGLAWVAGNVRVDPSNPRGFLNLIEVDTYGDFEFKSFRLICSSHNDFPEFADTTAVPFTDATPLGVSYSLFEKNETLYWRVVRRGITIALFAHRAVWPFTPKVIESLRQHRDPSPSTTDPKEYRSVNFFGLLDAAIDFEDAGRKVSERNRWLHVCVHGNAMARAAAIACAATLSIENSSQRHEEEQATTPQFSVVVDDWTPGG